MGRTVSTRTARCVAAFKAISTALLFPSIFSFFSLPLALNKKDIFVEKRVLYLESGVRVLSPTLLAKARSLNTTGEDK